jgi:hypothetical protein
LKKRVFSSSSFVIKSAILLGGKKDKTLLATSALDVLTLNGHIRIS